MSQFFLRFLFVFLLSSGHVHASREQTIRRLRPLSVPVGKSAFIQPDDVIVSRDRNATSCVVKVADDDVATLLRVGTVTPMVRYNLQLSSHSLLYYVSAALKPISMTFCSVQVVRTLIALLGVYSHGLRRCEFCCVLVVLAIHVSWSKCCPPGC